MSRLDEIVNFLAASAAVGDKAEIHRAYAPAAKAAGGTRLGDDCAAIPDPTGGYLLLAAEGLLESFVRDDPWFAGYSAVMVNISDICAMGGRPTAIVDVIWTPDYAMAEPVWEGMRAASGDYGVPIVGGHTTLTHRDDAPLHLAAAIVGKAERLLTSFDARPGDDLMMVVDMNAAYRGDKPFWNASVGTPPERLQEIIQLPARLAENGWCLTAKDISNGGVVGTLIMMLACSRVGAVLHMDKLPAPPDTALEKWLISFPSYGYLLSVDPSQARQVADLFAQHDLTCETVGEITDDPSLEIRLGAEAQTFWRLEQDLEPHA